jgi:hypothetical protein
VRLQYTLFDWIDQDPFHQQLLVRTSAAVPWALQLLLNLEQALFSLTVSLRLGAFFSVGVYVALSGVGIAFWAAAGCFLVQNTTQRAKQKGKHPPILVFF